MTANDDRQDDDVIELKVNLIVDQAIMLRDWLNAQDLNAKMAARDARDARQVPHMQRLTQTLENEITVCVNFTEDPEDGVATIRQGDATLTMPAQDLENFGYTFVEWYKETDNWTHSED